MENTNVKYKYNHIEKDKTIFRDHYNTIKNEETGEINLVASGRVRVQSDVENAIEIFNKLYESLQEDINNNILTKESLTDYMELMAACIVFIKGEVLTESQKFELKNMTKKLIEAKKIRESILNGEFVKEYKMNTK